MRVGDLFWSDRTYYAPGHTWVRRTGLRRVTVGLDDLAQRLFPAPSGISLAAPGTVVREGDRSARFALRAPGAKSCRQSPARSPASTRPSATTRHCSTATRTRADGCSSWFRPTPESNRCRTGEDARTWLREEGERLSRFFEAELGVAAADGGEFVVPPPTLLKDEQWVRLTQEFLANR